MQGALRDNAVIVGFTLAAGFAISAKRRANVGRSNVGVNLQTHMQLPPQSNVGTTRGFHAICHQISNLQFLRMAPPPPSPLPSLCSGLAGGGISSKISLKQIQLYVIPIVLHKYFDMDHRQYYLKGSERSRIFLRVEGLVRL